jgi:iron-sulfur cluster repair protein YtfE (RIC family)
MTALDRVAHILSTHHDHVWGRLPFLGPMAVRVDRERGAPGRLSRLITQLRDLLFSHLDREDRVLLAIAADPTAPGLAAPAARLRDEHAVVTRLLDELHAEVGDAPGAGPTERALRAELRELDAHLRAQIGLEEAFLA